MKGSQLTAFFVVALGFEALANSGGSLVGNQYIGNGPMGSQVVIDSGVMGDVYGGMGASTSRNTVSVIGGQIGGGVVGGLSNGGASNGEGESHANSIMINGGKVVQRIRGGYSSLRANGGAVYDNRVEINNGEVLQDIYGGESTSGMVSRNTVVINGGQVGYGELSAGQGVSGGFSDSGMVSGNAVLVRGGKINGVINGGWTTGNGAVLDNTISIYGGEFGQKIRIVGGSSVGNVSNNAIMINGGNLNAQAIVGGVSSLGEISNNSIILSGGRVSGNVIGAMGGNNPRQKIHNNTITLRGDVDVSKARLQGSNRFVPNGENDLVIDGWSGSVESVKNFNTLSLKEVQWKNGGAVLNITGGARDDLAKTKINLENVNLSGSGLKKGDKMNFVLGNVDLGIKEENISIADFTAGVSIVGKASVKVDGMGLGYEVSGVQNKPGGGGQILLLMILDQIYN